MGFVIKKITVHSDPTKVRSSEDHYNMVREKWDVRSLLEVFLLEIFITLIKSEITNYVYYFNVHTFFLFFIYYSIQVKLSILHNTFTIII